MLLQRSVINKLAGGILLFEVVKRSAVPLGLGLRELARDRHLWLAASAVDQVRRPFCLAFADPSTPLSKPVVAAWNLRHPPKFRLGERNSSSKPPLRTHALRRTIPVHRRRHRKRFTTQPISPIEIRKPPIWYVAYTSWEHTGWWRQGGHGPAHDCRLCATTPPPTSTLARTRIPPPRTPPANSPLQVLAVDLLNPSPQHEARQHKLKV